MEERRRGGIVSSVLVVFDLEGSDSPFPIGVYHSTEEDVIVYVDPTGSLRSAPCDCVTVVAVDPISPSADPSPAPSPATGFSRSF